MKSKNTKLVSLLLCCIMICMIFTGCSGNNGSKKVKVKTLTSEISLTKVDFYDFYNGKFVSNYSSGYCTVLSNSLNSKEVWFVDSAGITRTICTDKELAKKPKNVKVYTNSGKTKYDTYNCEY